MYIQVYFIIYYHKINCRLLEVKFLGQGSTVICGFPTTSPKSSILWFLKVIPSESCLPAFIPLCKVSLQLLPSRRRIISLFFESWLALTLFKNKYNVTEVTKVGGIQEALCLLPLLGRLSSYHANKPKLSCWRQRITKSPDILVNLANTIRRQKPKHPSELPAIWALTPTEPSVV